MRTELGGGMLTRVLALVPGFGRRTPARDGSDSGSADWPGPDYSPRADAVPCRDGMWPDDPHEVPEWMVKSIAWHKSSGKRPLGYRTKAEFDALVSKIEAEEEFDAISSRTSPKPKLSPEDAAIDFIGAIRAAERTGQYLSDELTAAYLDHCTATNRRPTAENHLRAALKLIPGVKVEKINIEGPKRHRPTVWIIDSVDDVEIHEPMRMAA